MIVRRKRPPLASQLDAEQSWCVGTRKAKGRSRLATSSFRTAVSCLVEAEVNFHVNLNGDRLAILHGRFESPLADGFDSLLIEAHAQAAGDFDVARMTGRINDEP